ncbi:MAG: hypothetical protein ABR498_05925 [Candidatus Dormibacteria bacterium]
MSIPISALQRNAAAVVRRIAASGRSEEITDRGRVVAVIGPRPEQTGLARLEAAGHVRPAATVDWDKLWASIDGAQRVGGLMEALMEQRDSDR